MTALHRRRHLVQAAMALFVIVVGVRHQLEEGTPSVDALCPFGGVETLWTWITTGQLISKTHPSNLVLGAGLLIAVILAGNAFCGWICPFGAVQDALTWVRRRLHLPSVEVPERIGKLLGYGRFVVLALVIWMSVTTANLWFAGYDPYVTLFGLHWLFEPNLATMWLAWVILAAIVGLSLVVERAWCRFLCPLGGVLTVLNHVSFLRIRRSATACTDCNLCVKPCPMGIDASKPVKAVSADCIGCLECVAACPFKGALEVKAALPWQSWGKLDVPAARPRRVPVTIGSRPAEEEEK
jgi:polyferredoxin